MPSVGTAPKSTRLRKALQDRVLGQTKAIQGIVGFPRAFESGHILGLFGHSWPQGARWCRRDGRGARRDRRDAGSGSHQVKKRSKGQPMTRTRLLTALCLLPLFLSPALCRAQQKTLITDTLFQADGTRASGTAMISWPAFTSPDNFPIAQGTLTTNIANGAISVQLVPTIGSTPAGASYTVSYFLTNSVSYTEYWTIPATGSATLTQVRTTPVPVPTTTFGEHQLTLGNGLQTPLGIWRQSTAPVATAEGQCYWDLPTHAIKCTDQTLSFNALGGAGQLPSTLVYNNQANVYSSGLQDFGAAGAVLPKSADPASPITGQVWINSGALKYRDNSGTPATQVVEIQSNKNTANGYAGLTASAFLAATQFPALTGDVTTAGGSLTTTLPNIVTAATNTKITFNAKGQVTAGAQAQFSDIGGTLGATQFPALAGDVTTTAGSLTATLPNIVTAATNTKITYNAKGQVTAGAQAAASDLSNGTSGSGAVILAGSPTITDLTVNQNANGDDTIAGKRKTDTSPTGNLMHFQNAAANADLWTVDVTGTLQSGSVPGARVSGNIAGSAATATALASTPSQCASNNFATGVAASGNANCSQPSAANLSNGTTGSGSVVLATSPTITTPTISGALGGNLDLGGNAAVVEITNDTTTGTAANELAKLTGATSAAIKAATTDSSGVIGIVVAGAGTSGKAQIANEGQASCAFDGTTIAGDYVQISSSVAGDCHDAGSSLPSNGQIIGRVLTTNGSAGTYAVLLGLNSPSFIDFPDVKTIPAANCSATTGGNGWSIGSGGTVTCRAGTNNLGGYISITDTFSTFAQFAVTIPEDWDSGSNPYIRFFLASTDATNGHTIIPAIQVSCQKGDGSTTDDVTFNAAHSLSTVTLNGNANRFWSTSNVQMNSTDVTGCVAGALMIVSVQRATDTATNAEFYSAAITFPRRLVVQAN